MNKTVKGNSTTYIFLVGAMLCWGLSFVWYKQALEHFGPITLVLSRLLVSLPLLIISALLLKRIKKLDRTGYSNFYAFSLLRTFLIFSGRKHRNSICIFNGCRYLDFNYSNFHCNFGVSSF